jgi:NAD(P)-dependent dehydrogenase (short-subunit alcohol dehydrogenase family)
MAGLSGRTVAITGGAQGIGAVVATALAAAGAGVAIADVQPPTRTVEAIEEAGGQALGMSCDVTSRESVERFAGETLSRFGRIDGLVTVAAMFTALHPQPFDQISSDEFDRVMTVNVRGTFEAIRAVTPAMRSQRHGSIVTIGSGTTFKGMPLWLHYVASKGAIIALTRVLARELGADGIRVNCVAPGLTLSEGVVGQPDSFPTQLLEGMIATRCLPREQTPHDLVGVIGFLLSPDSEFMSGQTLVVDGGSVLH